MKDLATRTQSEKVLRDKAFKLENDPKYDGYQRGSASMICKFFNKMSSGRCADVEPIYQLAGRFYCHIIRKFKKQKKFPSFRDNISGADLADTKSLRKCNQGTKYLLSILVFNRFV